MLSLRVYYQMPRVTTNAFANNPQYTPFPYCCNECCSLILSVEVFTISDIVMEKNPTNISFIQRVMDPNFGFITSTKGNPVIVSKQYLKEFHYSNTK